MNATNEHFYGTYTKEEWDDQYDLRKRTPAFEKYVSGWLAETESVKKQLRFDSEIKYGTTNTQVLDVCPSDRHLPSPVHIFFHGGGWRSMSKNHFAYLARAFNKYGVATVVVDYGLLPTITMQELVRECRDAIPWVYRNIGNYNGDNSRIFVSGHSAGAHVAAMLSATNWIDYGVPADVIKGATVMSGLYELEPTRRSSTYSPLGIGTEDVLTCTPTTLRPPLVSTRFVVAAGAHETAEFRRHSTVYVDFLKGAGVQCEHFVVEGHNHYSILGAFESDHHPLGLAVLRQMGVR